MSKHTITDFYTQKYKYLLIHYSCENFQKEDTTSRITSIAIKCLLTGETDSFSLIHSAEELKIDTIEDNYDIIEKHLLAKFFAYAKKKKDKFWIHWGMKDKTYGFKALEHRANVLGLKSIFKIADDRKYDLSKILFEIHGNKYVEDPKLENLLKINEILPKDFLSGLIEAQITDNKLVNNVYQSTQTKVHAFEEIIQLEANNKLKTLKHSENIKIGFLQKKFNKIKDNWGYHLFISPYWNSLFINIIIPSIINELK